MNNPSDSMVNESGDDMPVDWDEALGLDHSRVKPYVFICGYVHNEEEDEEVDEEGNEERVVVYEAHTRIMQLDPTNAEEIAAVMDSSIRLDKGRGAFCAFVISMDLSYGMQIYQGNGKRVLMLP